ncbi:transmembrane protein, putative (macronuclear) [Tetrahymena thermophila SB210]|uniref:Transmembrane protein, putative n=1 Tax=Tetrahymena thermophila (strain SB210) TaxID=312017 RepID=I7LX57_TETTS|nr:transmembrane protein, putative [Tetrahymena thermophila SB210]EAS03804.1 transmembrane protein, putative [Tetrahymena thermophila SB210]|eukprot:XP_001024049.1 transmembrane protein, putative [Tetrahymena thermophila SB210]
MSNKLFLSAILFLGLLVGTVYSQVSLELQVQTLDSYQTKNTYILAAKGVFGGNQNSDKDSCSESFTIQTNQNQFSQTDMVLPNARRCGDVSNVSLSGYTTELGLGGVEIPVYLRYGQGTPIFDFSDSDSNIPNLLYTLNKVKNPVFYFNLKNNVQLVNGFKPKSFLYIGDSESTTAQQGTEVIVLPKLGNGGWQLPLKNINFQGKSYQVSDEQPFLISSYDSIGLGQQGYQEFLKPLVQKKAIIQNKKLGYVSINKNFLNDLPNITLQVEDINGVLQNLNIPSQNYVLKVNDEYILKVDDSNQVGYPLYYNYLIGFDRNGKQFLFQQKQDSLNASSF